MSDSLASAIEAAALWLASREGITVKTIGQVTTKYSDELTNAVFDVWNGHSSAIDLRRAHKAMLKDFAPQVYEEGLREGGFDDIDDEDQAVMDEVVGDWLGGQFEHVNSFAKDVEAIKGNKDERPKIVDRVAQWVDSLRSLGDLGKAYALKNERGQWIMGDTEHCDTCSRLSKMKAHRVSWFTDRGYIPGENGSATLDCHGFNCQCGIYDKKGSRLL